jgi:hypothetical protein
MFHLPRQRQQTGWDSKGRLHSMMRVSNILPDAEIVGWDSPLLPGWRWWLIDTGNDGFPFPADGETAIQNIFAEDDTRATMTMNDETFPFLPGDNVLFDEEVPVSLSPGMIVLAITTGQPSGRIITPTHGVDDFDGFNRRTRCLSGNHLRLERWKLTGPQRIAVTDSPVIVCGLFGRMSLIGESEIHPLPSFSTVVSDAGVTVVPDGLGYIAGISPVSPADSP